MEHALTSIIFIEKVILHDLAVSENLGLGIVLYLQSQREHLHKIHNKLNKGKKHKSRGGYRKNWIDVHSEFVTV